MAHPILTDAQAKMKKAVDHTLHEFSSIHTGKATPQMVEGVMVEAYGSMTPLKQCAAMSTPVPSFTTTRRGRAVAKLEAGGGRWEAGGTLLKRGKAGGRGGKPDKCGYERRFLNE